MNPLMLNKTHTTKFVLPMVFEDYVKYDKILTEDFENAYIADMENPDSDNSIVLVHNNKMIQKLISNKPKDVYQSTPIEDNLYYDIEIYDVPEEWVEDYYQFMSGSYTNFSEKYKQKLLYFWDKDEDSELYKILHRIYPDNRIELELEKDIDFDALDEFYPPPIIINEIYENKGGL